MFPFFTFLASVRSCSGIEVTVEVIAKEVHTVKVS